MKEILLIVGLLAGALVAGRVFNNTVMQGTAQSIAQVIDGERR